MKASKIIFLLFTVLVLGSCITPKEFAEKRIARILKRHPELVKTDTVWKTDSITIAGVSKDSTFHFYQHDTVTLKKDNVTVKYYFRKDSTVYLQGKCDPVVKKYFYPVIRTVASIPAQLTFWEKVQLWLFKNGWWVVLLIWGIWKIFGKALKAYFPWLNILSK